jgi:release factor glutamine methyltransferase
VSNTSGDNRIKPDTYTAILRIASQHLASAGVDDPMRDARRLLAFVLDVPISRLTLALQDQSDPNVTEKFLDLIAKRTDRQPVSQLLGKREFWGRSFSVTPDVLDPRPDTETLVEHALMLPFSTVLDLGTGSGCILLSLLGDRSDAIGTGSDASADALAVATANAAQLGLQDRATFLQSDWYQDVAGKFDLITSNPPYVTANEYETLTPEIRNWEPKLALTPGSDGLSACRTIAAGAAMHLRPGGHLIVEIGATQAVDVMAIFVDGGLTDCSVKTDINDHDRVVIGQLP